MKNLSKSLGIYESLLDLYPASFKRQYGSQMIEAADDMISDAAGIDRIGVMIKLYAELPASIAYQRLIADGTQIARRPRQVVRRIVITSLVVLTPFFAVPVFGYFHFHDAYFQLSVDRNFSLIWQLALPLITVYLIAKHLIGWSLYLRSKSGRSNAWIKKAWPLVAVGLMAVPLSLLAISTLYSPSENRSIVASAVAQATSPSHACQAFPLESAKKLLGSKAVMNNARQYGSGEIRYDGILSDTPDEIVSSCSYAIGFASLIIQVSDPKNSAAQTAQRRDFFTNLAAVEEPIRVSGYDGFYTDPTDKNKASNNSNQLTELRLWAKGRWVEVSASSLEMAIGAINVVINNL